MKLNTEQLIQQLINEATIQLKYVEQLQVADHSLLHLQPAQHSWSILQILEHVNTYSAYYLPLIANVYIAAPAAPTSVFTPGWLGNYFVGMMQPLNGAIKKKYKASSKHQPGAQLNSGQVLTNYINHQKHLIALLEKARQHDLNSVRIPISIAPFIKLKLGDVLRFIVAHQQRHMLQMQKIFAPNKSSEQAV